MGEEFKWEQEEGQHTLDLRIISKEDGSYLFQNPRTGEEQTCANMDEAYKFMQSLLGGSTG